MVLESLMHEDNSFLTLTYNQEHLPADGNLDPAHLRDFLKRFRFALWPQRVRYFAVGEYGEESWRPHYHLSLFGFGVGQTLESTEAAARAVGTAWGKGNIYLAEFNELTAAYVAGYVVKKLTASGDWRLDGRRPEFARMSTRPGLGASAMEKVAASLEGRRLNDAPMYLNMGRGRLVLGRYLRRILRGKMGFSEQKLEELKQQWVHEKETEVFGLLAAAKRDGRPYLTSRQAIVADALGRIRSIEARSKMKRKVGL